MNNEMCPNMPACAVMWEFLLTIEFGTQQTMYTAMQNICTCISRSGVSKGNSRLDTAIGLVQSGSEAI